MKRLFLLAGLVAASLGASCKGSDPALAADDRTPAEKVDLVNGPWPGPAISYGGYREGQSPATGVYPTDEQITEDMHILARNWRLIRLYAADQHGEDVLRILRREKLDIAVMLGVWLDREPGGEEANARQVSEGIRLAREYEDIITAVNVGNEVRVEWTAHPVPEKALTRYVRQVREAITQPVTMADNYVWWRDDGADLAKEVDFITIHTYPIWERLDIDRGLSYTIENYEGVRAAHPDMPIVIGEAGWASYTEGNLHVPRAGDEAKQTRYYEELLDWSHREGITIFWFEAFDEPWKPSGTESHWGLFSEGRKAKAVMDGLYPELATDEPTSPGYPEVIETKGPALAVAFRSGFAEPLTAGSVNPLGPGLLESDVVAMDGAEGGTALGLSLTGDSWSGVYFALGSYDASKDEALAMQLQLPASLASLELKLEAREGDSVTLELMDYTAGEASGGWTPFRIPASALGSVDRTQLTILGMWNPRDAAGEYVPGDLLIDDIRFE